MFRRLVDDLEFVGMLFDFGWLLLTVVGVCMDTANVMMKFIRSDNRVCCCPDFSFGVSKILL